MLDYLNPISSYYSVISVWFILFKIFVWRLNPMCSFISIHFGSFCRPVSWLTLENGRGVCYWNDKQSETPETKKMKKKKLNWKKRIPQFRQRRRKTCVPSRRTAVRCAWSGARRRWTNRTATYRTTSCTTSKPRGPTRKPSKWCSKVRCKAARNSNWRSSKSGPNIAFGFWPAPSSVMDLPPSPSPFEPRKMVRISTFKPKRKKKERKSPSMICLTKAEFTSRLFLFPPFFPYLY